MIKINKLLRLKSFTFPMTFGLVFLFSISCLADQTNNRSSNNKNKLLDPSIFTVYQKIAIVNALETDTVNINSQWKKIKFINDFTNPVVIPISDTTNWKNNNNFMIGIRNTNSNGFEIKKEPCFPKSGQNKPHEINFVVLEQGQYPISDGSLMEIKQRFLWGHCVKNPTRQSVSF